MPLLSNGQVFPAIDVAVGAGKAMSLPADVSGSFAVVLVYRGAWCPFCRAQLAEFEAEKAALDGLGVRVVALSIDDEATTAALVEAERLGFTVGHDADADAIATATGAFVNDAPRHLQPTGFILDPDGKVSAAVYATHAVGRLVAADAVKLITFLKSKRAGG